MTADPVWRAALARVATAGESAARARVATLAAALESDFPDIAAHAEGSRIVLQARGLIGRLFATRRRQPDARLQARLRTGDE